VRDILTAVAGAVIVILVAALAVPPFVDWEAQRGLIDRTISRAIGMPARSEGRIGVRLLPSPRLRLDRLRLGEDPGRPGLDLRFVKAEIGLTPLLTGNVRFTETRIGRAEVKLPVDEGDTVLLPADMGAAGAPDLAIDDVQVQQLLLTTVASATGRTDQIRADDVSLSAPRLTGPWRLEGNAGGVPFRVASGEPGEDGTVAIKITGGGDTHPRFEADARIGLTPVGSGTREGLRAVIPEGEGTARLVVGPPAQAAGAYLPFSLAGKFRARGPVARFEEVSAEIDPGGQALRLAGTGRLDLRAWRAALTLGSRRIDLDGFLMSAQGQALLARGSPSLGRGLPVMVDLDLAVDSLGLGLDEWTGLRAAGTLNRSGGLSLRRFAATAPGAAALTASGEIDTAGAPRFNGQLSVEAPDSEGIGRYLRKLGLEGPAVAVLDGQPIQATADVSVAAPTLSLRNLRLSLGTARITGNARYTKGEGETRGRFDAQIAAQGIDVARLPTLSGALAGLHGHDIGLTVQARDVRYGPAGASSGNGTIAASIQSDGPALVVDSLDVTDLAGANAKLSGRIAPDGSGRIAGRVTAPVAAPLLALLDRVWIAEARLLPAFLRAGALDLDVTVEREAAAADTLRSTAKGGAAGGRLALAAVTREGRIDSLDLSLATPQLGQWFGRSDLAGLRWPADLRITGTRQAPDGERRDLGLTVEGSGAGLTLSTLKPLVLGPDQSPPRAGEVKIEAGDLSPFLSLAGDTFAVPGPLPAALVVGLSSAGADAHAEISGTVGGTKVAAKLDRAPGGEIAGSAALSRLSLPWIVSALALPPDPRAAGRPSASTWSSARFGPPPAPRPTVDVDLRADVLELGRGILAGRATFGLRLDDGTLTLREFVGDVAKGRLAGSLSVARQGGAGSVSGEASLTDASIPALFGPTPIAGRLAGTLRFGASGESLAGLINNLGGSGEIALADLSLPGGDPAGLDRALTRALAEDDPLREGRLQSLIAEELATAPLTAAGPVTAPATVVGGTLRAGPLNLDLGAARWAGTLGLDLRSLRLDARGTLSGATAPKGWTGGLPAIQLGYSGALARPERSVDAGALTNGLAALVLQRELEKIELFEADQAERQRRRARIEMDAVRAAALKAAADKAAVEKAAAEKAAAEEAARQARIRAQQAAAEELARQARIREAEEAARRAQAERPASPPVGEPLDIRPQAQP
jgi:hypothetical protein